MSLAVMLATMRDFTRILLAIEVPKSGVSPNSATVATSGHCWYWITARKSFDLMQQERSGAAAR